MVLEQLDTISEYMHVYIKNLSYISDLSNPEIEPRSPALQVNSLPVEPSGKPKDTRVGSLSLSPGDLHDQGIKLGSPALQADSLPAELPWKSILSLTYNK